MCESFFRPHPKLLRASEVLDSFGLQAENKRVIHYEKEAYLNI